MAGQKNKNRKIGRNKKKAHCLAYKNERRHEKSHVRRILRHLKRYGEADVVAKKALTEYRVKAGIRTG